MAGTTGTTVGAANNFTPSCTGATTGTAPDRVYVLTLQVPVASLTLDTTGSAYDTTLSLTAAARARRHQEHEADRRGQRAHDPRRNTATRPAGTGTPHPT